jgi:hypothetical protein
MCVLMLSGAQTVGEIRTRGSRFYEFSGLEEVEQTLRELANKDEPLVVKLPRQPGQKDARFAHLLSGEPEVDTGGATEASTRPRRADDGDRIAKLETQIAALTQQVETLSTQFAEFRKQFE